jgi:hypothetical protein
LQSDASQYFAYLVGHEKKPANSKKNLSLSLLKIVVEGLAAKEQMLTVSTTVEMAHLSSIQKEHLQLQLRHMYG